MANAGDNDGDDNGNGGGWLFHALGALAPACYTCRVAGVLAIWNDCVKGSEHRYEHWYRSEHLAERVAIEGFVAGWRYRSLGGALEGAPEYFTHYETRDADVLRSAAYRERIDNPTPLTREIMSGVFVNCIRSVCERRARVGVSRGAFVVPVRFHEPLTGCDRAAVLEGLADDPALLRGEVWQAVDEPGAGATAEQALRGPDGGISGCLLLEAATDSEARALLRRARREVPEAHVAGIYSLLCVLHATDRIPG